MALDNFIHEMVLIAEEAGALLESYHAGGQVTSAQKADGSPVSNADLEADRLIRCGLDRLDNSIPILSEESGTVDYAIRKNWGRYWLVDPLDGTKEFLSGRDDFTVNIALMEGNQPVAAVVLAPKKKLAYYASRETGSWKQTGKEKPQRIFSRLSKRNDEHIVVESNSHPSTEMEAFLKTIKIKNRIRIGSSLKFCYLAEGLATLYPRFVPSMEWDVAAGDAVFRYSSKTGEHSSPFIYNKESLVNPFFVLGLEDE